VPSLRYNTVFHCHYRPALDQELKLAAAEKLPQKLKLAAEGKVPILVAPEAGAAAKRVSGASALSLPPTLLGGCWWLVVVGGGWLWLAVVGGVGWWLVVVGGGWW